MELRRPGLAMEARDGMPAPPGEGEDYESLPAGSSPLTHMMAGAVAGILEHTVMYPVDSVKVSAVECRGRGMLTGVMALCAAGAWHSSAMGRRLPELPRLLGTSATFQFTTQCLFAALTYISSSFLGNPATRETLCSPLRFPTGDISPAPQEHCWVAGSLATVLHDAIMNPAEVVKQRMQMYNSPYRSMLHCIQTVSRTEGVGAFYRSYTTQLFMNIPFQAIHFITYECTQEQLNPQRQYHPGSHIISGAIAGAVAAAATTPLDVCKTLLNTQENTALSSANISGHLSGMANAIRTVYQIGGLRGYFKGMQARVIYQMPSTAIAWSVYEFFKYFLSNR
ncbi:PREDICTED: mitoferrin-1-like [Nanorana parkeri]|uniref:mitoferrin-1-like n=1 Tax=Nanorana parkeri TaxID=125878 RepID=UPI000854D5F5|nr:PREDICTED: mitoferrin-1-like [Nanorana parkeri]